MLNREEILTIQDYKKDGLSINQTAESLGYCYQTVKKYWNKKIDTKKEVKVERKCKCDKYRGFILKKLNKFNGYTSIQIYQFLEKHLKEQGKEIDVGESTMRRYIQNLRKEENIPKTKRRRQFRAVVDPEPGQQAQYDFGEYKVFVEGSDEMIDVYFAMLILTYSRYRYVEFRDKPFTTEDIIEILENGLDYFGGCPEEVVIDQDTRMIKKEVEGLFEVGDKFSAYLEKQPFRIRPMHKSDPQSKGRVERANYYIEQNFLNGYYFTTLEQLNTDALEWLETIANQRVHSITKEPPAKRFEREKPHLTTRGNSDSYKIVSQQISLDNTVTYKGNRYDVPVGSYQPGLKKRARIFIYEEHIEIYSEESGEYLAEFHLEEGVVGKLYTLDGRKENSDSHVKLLKDEILKEIQDYPRAEEMVEKIISSNPDFRTDQLVSLRGLIMEWIVNKPFLYQCFEDFKDDSRLDVGMIREMINRVSTELDFDLKKKKTLNNKELSQKLGFLSAHFPAGSAMNYANNYVKYLENEFSKN